MSNQSTNDILLSSDKLQTLKYNFNSAINALPSNLHTLKFDKKPDEISSVKVDKSESSITRSFHLCTSFITLGLKLLFGYRYSPNIEGDIDALNIQNPLSDDGVSFQ